MILIKLVFIEDKLLLPSQLISQILRELDGETSI